MGTNAGNAPDGGHGGVPRSMLSFWQDCSRELEREMSPQQFAAWIKPLKAL